MPNLQYGIPGLSQGVLNNFGDPTQSVGKEIFSSRVKDIILDKNHINHR